jgi:hypothetical protein
MLSRLRGIEWRRRVAKIRELGCQWVEVFQVVLNSGLWMQGRECEK